MSNAEPMPGFMRRGLIATGLAASLAITGCTASNPDNDSSSTPTPTHTTEIITDPTCLQPRANEDDANMQACARLRSGRIALVDFGTMGSGYKYHAADVGDITMKALGTSTGGYIAPTAVTIPATPAAVAALRVLQKTDGLPGKCVPAGNEQDWMSTVAKRTMAPELKTYAMVEAIGSRSCQKGTDNVGGIADPEHGVADVYSNADRGGIVIGGLSHDQTLAGVDAHETLHLFGLGHSGAIECDNVTQRKPEAIVNLGGILASRHCSYQEYGNGGNVMSSFFDVTRPNDLLNDMQRDELRATSLNSATEHHGSLLGESGDSIRVSAEPNKGITYADTGVDVAVDQDVEFSRLAFTVGQFSNYSNKTKKETELTEVEVFLSTGYGSELYVQASIDTFPLPKSGTIFEIGKTRVRAQLVGKQAIFTLIK